MYVPPAQPGQLAAASCSSLRRSAPPGQFERIAKALADPRRFDVLRTIANAQTECPYQAICNQFPVTKATISHHLKELVQAGLVRSEREGQTMHASVVPGVIEAYAAELVRRLGEPDGA